VVTEKGNSTAQEKDKTLKDYDENKKERLEQMRFIFSSSIKKKC
jgi:hypothetical protein